MTRAPRGAAILASVIVVVGGLPQAASAAPAPADMLKYSPHQQGVNCSTPAAHEVALCKVELVSGSRPGSSGWLLRDPRGQPLRKFMDTAGLRRVDLWSYYLDGVEVYREMSSTPGGKIDQYRWMNAGGMKWGVDLDHDGKIDTWKMISPEEVSQEVLQAVLTRDFARLQALWLSDAEMKELELPASEITRLRTLKDQATSKFQATCGKLALGTQARWERLDSSGPQCAPAEHTGAGRDLVKYLRSTVLYDNNGKHDWLQTGEMIQVGMAWRIVDAPAPGNGADNGEVSSSGDPQLQAMLDELRQLDAQAPKGQEMPGPNAAVMTYNLKRAGIVQRVLGRVKPDEREQWVHQLADCLSTAAQSSNDGDKSAYNQLVQLAEQMAREQPGSPLAAYVAFREMSADYGPKLSSAKGGDFNKVQEQWIARLTKFVQDYAKAEDTPDALLQLGMVSEFLGKEIEAKKWYQQLSTNFADKRAQAEKAEGALRRLDLEGKTLELAGNTVEGRAFNIAQLRGKMVVVYYWASYIPQSVGDFARLKVLADTYGSKGLELVCVNLDNSPPLANSTPVAVPGVQLYQPGGLDSALATQYGIMVLPNMFLVGKDGNVISRNMQLANLEDELKKQLK